MSETYPRIAIKELPSGYLHARGKGPCEWAQWPKDRTVEEGDFFPEASEQFRAALRRQLEAVR